MAVGTDIRVCSQHPISKFVSNDSSSPPHLSFVSALTSLFVPQGLQEQLEIPKSKETIVEEMGTLSKNDTWQLVSLPTGKKQLAANWSLQLNKWQIAELNPINRDWLQRPQFRTKGSTT